MLTFFIGLIVGVLLTRIWAVVRARPAVHRSVAVPCPPSLPQTACPMPDSTPAPAAHAGALPDDSRLSDGDGHRPSVPLAPLESQTTQIEDGPAQSRPPLQRASPPAAPSEHQIPIHPESTTPTPDLPSALAALSQSQASASLEKELWRRIRRKRLQVLPKPSARED